jgi:hypothetical protein
VAFWCAAAWGAHDDNSCVAPPANQTVDDEAGLGQPPLGKLLLGWWSTKSSQLKYVTASITTALSCDAADESKRQNVIKTSPSCWCQHQHSKLPLPASRLPKRTILQKLRSSFE